MVALNYKAGPEAPDEGPVPVPENWYNAAIDLSEMRPAKTNPSNAYLLLRAKIIDGPFLGKTVAIRLNIQNDKQQAVDIAYGELGVIALCCGLRDVADSSMLHGIPFRMKVIVRKSAEHGDQNEVKAYESATGQTATDIFKSGQTAGGQAPAQFGGQAPAQQQMQPPAGQAQNPAAFGGQPAAQQPVQQPPAQQPPAQGGWGGQPAAQDPNAGQMQPPAQQQMQPPAQQTQAAQPPAQPQGNGGWAQDPNAAQGAAAQGGAPWGQQG